MSDTTDRFGFARRRLLNEAKRNPLRDRMRPFVAEHGDDGAGLEALRHEASRAKALSEVIDDERDEHA